MKISMFIKRLLKPSQEKLQKIKDKNEQKILMRMAQRYHQDGKGFLLLQATDARHALARSGFIQILDGGNKESPSRPEWCVISSNGLNHLGYSGR